MAFSKVEKSKEDYYYDYFRVKEFITRHLTNNKFSNKIHAYELIKTEFPNIKEELIEELIEEFIE
jgi:hypothetical protein